ncbi:MarR family winged helix-turn-helix transcriptional regulator [Cupriavidus sp. BIC8F]|uniref:MarR family winged helix-turn-helix transcriptional regulator n=1 Tax=Cupriavidus sp. BIC8F TaxID=3079014 RepID=UPI002916840E|nr:MarR family transcriptional regulator [Cupriavidus sp. BIC8F]
MKPLTPTREIIHHCLAVRARVIARTVSSLHDEALAAHDITIAQLTMLAALGEIGPCAPRKLGDVLQLERSTVSRNLDLLMAKNLVATVSSDAKGVREVVLSSEGQLKIEAALPDWRAAQKQACELLGAEGARGLREAAATIWSVPD